MPNPKPREIETLETMARDMVGDLDTPDLFFVSDQGSIVTVSRSFDISYSHWRSLADRSPMAECALENRRHGCIASVEPVEEGSSKLARFDDSPGYLRKR